MLQCVKWICKTFFQGLQTTPVLLAHLVIGAVDQDPPSSARQALRGPFLGLPNPVNVSPVQGEPSAQILRLQESQIWRGSPAGPLINAPWVASTQFKILTFVLLFYELLFSPKEKMHLCSNYFLLLTRCSFRDVVSSWILLWTTDCSASCLS